MKAFLTLALVSFVSVSANAADLNQFVGKYTPGNCTIEGDRVYVSLSKAYLTGAMSVDLKFYDSDSRWVTLQHGSVTKINTDKSDPVKSVTHQGIVTANVLRVLEIYNYKNGKKEVVTISTLTKTKTGLTYNSKGKFDNDSCDLFTAK